MMNPEDSQKDKSDVILFDRDILTCRRESIPNNVFFLEEKPGC